MLRRSRRVEQCVGGDHVVLAQGADSGLQPELRHQRIENCLGQIAAGDVHLVVGIQHVDVDAHADFEAQPVGFQRRLRRDQRRLERAYLRQPVGGAEVLLTCLQGGVAPGLFEGRFGRRTIGARFALAGNYRAALENRQVELDADILEIGFELAAYGDAKAVDLPLLATRSMVG